MFWEFESSVIRGHGRRYLFDITIFRSSEYILCQSLLAPRTEAGQGGDGARWEQGETGEARTRTGWERAPPAHQDR